MLIACCSADTRGLDATALGHVVIKACAVTSEVGAVQSALLLSHVKG